MDNALQSYRADKMSLKRVQEDALDLTVYAVSKNLFQPS